MKEKPLIKILKKALAEQYSLSFKAQVYHWNIEGSLFTVFHALFEEHYKSLVESVDTTAEMIRQLGVKIPQRLDSFLAEIDLSTAEPVETAENMISDLCAAYKKLECTFKDMLACAAEEDDAVIVDFATQRLSHLRKTIWMLQSTLS